MPTRKEKTAIARIFADLIKADRIVDIGEMEFWEKICEKYGIDRETHLAAKAISFAAALDIIADSKDDALRKNLLSDCRAMTVSDGFCAHSEALIMSAIILKLEEGYDGSVEVYSIPRANFNIDVATVVYVEAEFDYGLNSAIRKDYRSIFKEFQLAGFHFIYLPKIIDHYRETEPARFKQILGFLAPDMSAETIEQKYNGIMSMTSASFCEDVLCNKCGIDRLRHTFPSLLIKFGNSFVGDEEYANYLQIEIDNNILQTVQSFVDSFCDMLSSDVFVVKTSEEADNQFHFFGFYKQLLEIFLVHKNIRSNVIINPFSSQIEFKGIGRWLNGVNLKERAFYALLLCQGKEGLNLSTPSPAKMEAYKRRMDKYQRRFNEIYRIFDGRGRPAPDLSNRNIINPLTSHLRGALQRMEGLYNPLDYQLSQEERHYFVHLDQSLVKVITADSSEPVPLLESEFYKEVMNA